MDEMNEEVLVEQPEVEEPIEQVEQPTEQPRMYTQEEVDSIVSRKKARAEAKVRREYEQKYGELEGVLRAGTGKQSVEELTDAFKGFYQQKGVSIPEHPQYSGRDLEVLAKAEAADIINSGEDEVVEEVDRLASKGVENMTAREKAVFKVLAEHRQATDRNKEFSALGIPAAVYESKEFKDFAGQFNSNAPASEIIKLFTKTQPQQKGTPIGSMKSGGHETEKTFYTPEEVDRLTDKDYDNPVIMQRVRESMLKW